MSANEIIDQNSCLLGVSACVFLTATYVGSFYVWRSSLSRDHPTTIKRRFFSAFCMMFYAPFFCHYFISEDTLARASVWELLGVRWPGLLLASIAPLFLTAVLFLGPLSMQYFAGYWIILTEPVYLISKFQDLTWVRNHIIAPLSEEWVFRACMTPVLLQCLDPMTAVFVGPLLFGIAHWHHIFDQIKYGLDLKTAFLMSFLQFSYTSVFGVYSAYLFMKTGHIIAPLMAHVFCNLMGFPNFGAVFYYPPRQRNIIIFCFLLGFAIWCLLLLPLTKSQLYENFLWET